MPWKDPLLEYLAKNTQSELDRPPLVRSRLGRVGFVPDGAIDCTLGEIADAGLHRLHQRLELPENRTFRIAYNLNLFDWRPWGNLRDIRRVLGTAKGGKHSTPDYDGGYCSTHTPGASMGQGVILRDNLDNYRAWLWTLDTERAEGLYLTRRRPRAAAA